MTTAQADSRDQFLKAVSEDTFDRSPTLPTCSQNERTAPHPRPASASPIIPQRWQTGSQPSLTEVLARREARVQYIQSLLKTHETVVCFKLNIPGPIKNNASIQALFVRGLKDIRASLPPADPEPARPDSPDSDVDKIISTLSLQNPEEEQALPALPTGPEYFLTTSLPAREVKRLMVGLEETPLGRLYDIDVFGPEGPLSRQDLGLPVRTCFLCDRPAPECARSRRHSLAELLSWVDQQINLYL